MRKRRIGKGGERKVGDGRVMRRVDGEMKESRHGKGRERRVR